MQLQPHHIFLFAIPLVISPLVLLVLHWYPWGRILPRLTTYIIGCSVVVGVPVLCMVIAELLGMNPGNLYWAAFLLIHGAVCGFATWICRVIDANQPKPLSLEDVANATR